METGAAYALDYLCGTLDGAVKGAGRSTMDYNIKNDTKASVRYARVADAKACEFCKMLSTRGFVYRTATTAGETSEYHNHCNCQIVPAFDVSLSGTRSYQWRESRSGRGYIQNNNSVRGTKADVVIERPDQLDRVIERYDKELQDGKITQEHYDEHVAAAREAYQNYDPNDEKLWDAYKSWAENYNPATNRHKTPTFSKNEGNLASMQALTDEYEYLIQNADNTQSLNAVWRRVCNSTNRIDITTAQYEHLATCYYQNPHGFKVIQGGLTQE